MKVLFLDVDGVLNSERDYEVVSDRDTSIFYRLNRKQIDMVHEIIKETGCKIVLSSSWRLMYGGRKALTCWGIPIHDVTPSLEGCRGAEIKAWLDAHPEVERYVIIDDDSDMLDEQLRHFEHTTFEHGMTETHKYRIIYALS